MLIAWLSRNRVPVATILERVVTAGLESTRGCSAVLAWRGGLLPLTVGEGLDPLVLDDLMIFSLINEAIGAFLASVQELVPVDELLVVRVSALLSLRCLPLRLLLGLPLLVPALSNILEELDHFYRCFVFKEPKRFNYNRYS